MSNTFMKIQLSSGQQCEIKECFGLQYLAAGIKAGFEGTKNPIIFIKYLMLELVEIDGIKLTEDHLNKLPVSDVLAITECISPMLDNQFSGK